MILSFEYLASVGTDTYHAYRTANEFFKTLDIALAVFGELIEAGAL